MDSLCSLDSKWSREVKEISFVTGTKRFLFLLGEKKIDIWIQSEEKCHHISPAKSDRDVAFQTGSNPSQEFPATCNFTRSDAPQFISLKSGP